MGKNKTSSHNFHDLKFWGYDAISRSTKVLPSKLYDYLRTIGIRKYQVGTDKKNSYPELVHQNGNVITKINKNFLITNCKEFIENYPWDAEYKQKYAIDALHKSLDFFSDKNLLLLDDLDSEFLCDQKDHSYFVFRNTVVDVSKDGEKLIPLNQVTGMIWDKEIIDFDFNLLTLDKLKSEADFLKFLSNVAGKQGKLVHLMSLIGYMLHRYKDPSKTKAVIFMDENIDDSPEGGTGKTLLIDAISKVRNIVKEDGKSFKPGERFSLQKVNTSTRILAIDDVDNKFDFQNLFELITGDFVIEKKYKDAYIIPFSNAPKVAITTNYTIKGMGGSYDRRKLEFALSSYYSKDHQPIDDFGHNFFDDWNDDEWNSFFNVMLLCCHLYLRNGIKAAPSESLELKKLTNETCEEFYEFAEAHILENEEYDKKVLFDDFVREYSFTSLYQRTFTTWIKVYARYKTFKVFERHSGDSNLIRLEA